MENDTIITKVQVAGRHDLLYKKVRVSYRRWILGSLSLLLDNNDADVHIRMIFSRNSVDRMT